MSSAPPPRQSPLRILSPDKPVLTWLIGGAFFLVGLIRLQYPHAWAFDERFYIPAAVQLYKGEGVFNREHPMLAKEIMAVVMTVLGYSPLTWRFGSLVFGTIGLLGFARGAAHWSGSDRTGNLTAFLLATNFLVLAMSRSAILDPYLFGFCGLGVLFLARYAAGGQRWALALGGLALGFAVACKWTAAPVLALACVVYAIHVRFAPRALAWGVLLLGIVPIAAYFATYLPAMAMRENGIAPHEWVALHRAMLDFHAGFFPANFYNSDWKDWLLNTGPTWSYHEFDDDMLRIGVIGFNPLQAPLIVLASLAGLLAGLRRDWRLFVPAAFFAALIAVWALNDRTNQYMHYYLLPSSFATIALAMLAQRIIASHRLRAAIAIVVGVAPMVWFWPVLTSAQIHGHNSEARYTALPGWDISHNPKEFRPVGPPESYKRRLYCLDHPRECY